jgi:protein-tyrosine phosphatase
VPSLNRFRILCVCTGNICRSPAAERLLASRLGPEVEVSSAGTYALVGQPVSAPMDALVAGAGADPSGFAARRLTERLLQPVDLVLALTRAHRGDAVELWPKAVRRAFTLKEFARLLEEMGPAALPGGGPAERLHAAVPLASSRRHLVADARSDDVVDPYRQPVEVYAEAFADIERAVAAIVAVVRPA